MPKRIAPALFLGALTLLAAAPAAGEEKPLWELGVAFISATYPSYRGSSHQSGLVAATPMIYYRGKIIQSDEDGLRGILFNNERVKVDFSGGVTPPVHGNGIRQGMPKLRPTLEIGPAVTVTLWQNATRKSKLNLVIPVRVSYAVTGHIKPAGIIFDPSFDYNIESVGDSGWNLGFRTGPIFGNQRQHRYFYEVEEQYARPGRPVYKASGGYSGARFVSSLSKSFNNDKFAIGGFIRYDNLRGAAFEDSPLVRTKHNWMAGIGMSWTLKQSETMVKTRD